MQESALESLIYIIDNPILTFFIVILAGFLSTKLVAAERRPGVIGFTIIGLLGFFLSHFMLTYAGWNEYLDGLRELRVIIELVAAFLGSFVVAGFVHFLKPS
jgi:uncharacterized membrane protein YeaQ/YmgE (transglycosylase-associated protein family)